MGFKDKKLNRSWGGQASFFKYRISDNRLGRFFAIDPLTADYPWNSPYAFSENRVTNAIELEGLEAVDLTVPASPDQVDTKVWTPVNANAGTERGHTMRWVDKDGNMLAYDAARTDLLTKKTTPEHWHVYNKEGKRLGADGQLAGYNDANGTRQYYKEQSKGPGDGHLQAGQKTKIKVANQASVQKAIVNTVKGPVKAPKSTSIPFSKLQKGARLAGRSEVAFNILGLFMNSPNSPLYLFHTPGEGTPNRAYPTNMDDDLYYEWQWSGTGTRIVTFYYDYDYINGQWRGVNPTGKIQLFTNDGREIF